MFPIPSLLQFAARDVDGSLQRDYCVALAEVEPHIGPNVIVDGMSHMTGAAMVLEFAQAGGFARADVMGQEASRQFNLRRVDLAAYARATEEWSAMSDGAVYRQIGGDVARLTLKGGSPGDMGGQISPAASDFVAEIARGVEIESAKDGSIAFEPIWQSSDIGQVVEKLEKSLAPEVLDLWQRERELNAIMRREFGVSYAEVRAGVDPDGAILRGASASVRSIELVRAMANRAGLSRVEGNDVAGAREFNLRRAELLAFAKANADWTVGADGGVYTQVAEDLIRVSAKFGIIMSIWGSGTERWGFTVEKATDASLTDGDRAVPPGTAFEQVDHILNLDHLRSMLEREEAPRTGF